MLGIIERGSVTGQELIHAHMPQTRPGLKEGADYPASVLCLNGSYHIRYTLDEKQVTCPACLAKIRETGN